MSAAGMDASAPGHGGVTTQLAAFIAGAASAPLDAKVIEKTKHHVVDTLAAILSGTALDVGRSAMRAAPAFAGLPESTIFGQPQRYPAYAAAMLNAMLAHADETDDSHERAKMHPGCGIVPAALAMAQRQRRPGLDVLRAVAAGYDVGARMVEALGAMALNHAGHSTHAFGALFGCGAAAGTLARLDEEGARRLLSYLAHEVSGLSCWMADHDHVQKAYVFGAMGAKNALFATLLCQAGWTGVDDALQGERTLLTSVARPGSGRGFDVPMRLGEEILGSNIKKWCVGSPVQAPLDCMQALGGRLPPAGRIESIVVEIRADEAFVVDNRDMPNICLQHLVALYAIDGGLTFASAHDVARMNDPVVAALRKRIRLVPSEALQQAGGRQGKVAIVSIDGSTLSHHVEHVRGTWGDPMPRQEVHAKARDLVTPLLGIGETERLLEALWDLENLDAGQLDSVLEQANASLGRAGLR